MWPAPALRRRSARPVSRSVATVRKPRRAASAAVARLIPGAPSFCKALGFAAEPLAGLVSEDRVRLCEPLTRMVDAEA